MDKNGKYDPVKDDTTPAETVENIGEAKKAQNSKRAESREYQRRSKLSLTALQVRQMGWTEPVAVI